MAGKNQVTLTFAGDSDKLTKAFDDVGKAAKDMDDDVGKASKSIKDSGPAFDRAAEGADTLDTRAMGFRDTLTGVQDTMGGVSQIAKGDLLGGFLTLGAGVGDLASGFANLLIPLGKTAILKAFAAGQWLINAAMSANPIGLVIIAIVALVAIFVVAWKKSDTFRAIVTGAFNAVWGVVKKVGAWFKDTLWPWLKGVFDKVGAAAGWLKDKIVSAFNGVVGWLKSFPGKVKGFLDNAVKGGEGLLNWFKNLPGKIAGFFKGLGSTISKPFSTAFANIKSFWNSTIGGKGFTVPGWVPKVGGKEFRIPYFHTGGVVSGAMGSETLAVLKAGERVISGTGSNTAPTELGPIYLEAHIDLGNDVTKVVQVEMRRQNRALRRDVKAA